MSEYLDDFQSVSLEQLHMQVDAMAMLLQSAEQAPQLTVVRDVRVASREDADANARDLQLLVAATCSQVAVDARNYAYSLPSWQEGQLAIEESLRLLSGLRDGTRRSYDATMEGLAIAGAVAEVTYEGNGRFILALAILPEILRLAKQQMDDQNPLTELRTDVFGKNARVVPVKIIQDAVQVLGLDNPHRETLHAFLRLGIGVSTPPTK